MSFYRLQLIQKGAPFSYRDLGRDALPEITPLLELRQLELGEAGRVDVELLPGRERWDTGLVRASHFQLVRAGRHEEGGECPGVALVVNRVGHLRGVDLIPLVWVSTASVCFLKMPYWGGLLT